MQNPIEPIADPKFETIDEYCDYFIDTMERICNTRSDKMMEERDKQFDDKNRYLDILPYKHSQPKFYMNGNFVSMLGLDFFLTQAPLDILEFHEQIF